MELTSRQETDSSSHSDKWTTSRVFKLTVQFVQPQSVSPLFLKTARPCASFTLRLYVVNLLASLRRHACTWAQIGLAHLSIRWWRVVMCKILSWEKNPVLLKSEESTQKLCVLIERTLDFPFMCTTSRIVLFLSGYTYHTATNRIFCW